MSIEGPLHLPQRKKQIKTHIAQRRQALEDRILILRNRVDRTRMRKEFNPRQPRDAIGRWAATGASAISAVIKNKDIRAAVSAAVSNPHVRAGVSVAISVLVSAASGGGASNNLTDDVIDTHVKSVGTHAKISRGQAIEALTKTFQRLRSLRSKTMKKAEKDQVLEWIDQILEALDRLKEKAE